MARKAGQLISRGPRTWLVRISLGRDSEAGTRKYHNKTIRGSFREAQTYLSGKLQEREIGRHGDQSQSVLRSVAHNCSQAEATAEKLHRLRSAVAASHPPGTRDKADRRDHPVRHPDHLRSNV